MASANPQRFLRFAADNYPLLKDILDAGSLGWAQLTALIERRRRATDPELETIRENLLALGFLERQPDGDMLEMPQPVERFFRYIHREHHLTSAGQIQNYVDEIARIDRELIESLEVDAHQRLSMLAEELVERIELIRHDIGGNKEAITDAVIHFQANREEAPLRDLYTRVIWLWERYLAPVQDLIDTEQVMEQQLNSLDGSLVQAERGLTVERPDLAAMLRDARLRLYRMRRQVVNDFREAMLELQPLYRRALRESRTARAASRILDHVRREGVSGLNLERHIGVLVMRHEGLFSDLAAKAYLYNIADYHPDADVELDDAVDGDDSAAVARVDLPAMLEQLQQERPADTMAWLSGQVAEQGGGVRDLLMAYGRIVRRMETTAHAEQTEYRFGGYFLSARPRTLTDKRKADD
ncbi:MAG: hypothetical protein JJU08_06010 [Rhodobacteraceae bacterium]|nr:hypothetical protein [Paracoccaceae bacterium]